LDLKVVECKTERLLASASGDAEDRNKIVKVLGGLAYSLRAQLGEARSSLSEFNRPLEIATTSSVDALHEMYLAHKTDGNAEELPHVLRAVELDPSFVSAQVELCVAYSSLGFGLRMMEPCNKAYSLRERLVQKQKLLMEGFRYFIITGELDKAAEAYSELATKYPRSGGQNDLGMILAALGRLDEAGRMEWDAMRVIPDADAPYVNLVHIYDALNQLDRAREIFQSGIRKAGPDSSSLRLAGYQLAFLQRDQQSMKEALGWASGKTGTEDVMLSDESDTSAYYGRLK
jgi:tetratricopeptide (TPR) repeat protein